jgi:hypothetical protein
MEEPGTHVQKKVRRCLKCGRIIEEGWLCEKCKRGNKLIEDVGFYFIRYPSQRYWVGGYRF